MKFKPSEILMLMKLVLLLYLLSPMSKSIIYWRLIKVGKLFKIGYHLFILFFHLTIRQEKIMSISKYVLNKIENHVPFSDTCMWYMRYKWAIQLKVQMFWGGQKKLKKHMYHLVLMLLVILKKCVFFFQIVWPSHNI